MHQKFIPEDWVQKEVLITPKRQIICISCGFSKIIREKLRIPRTHSDTGNPQYGERISAENLKAIGKSFNLQKQQMTRKHGKTSGLFMEISYIVIKLNREFNFSCQERNQSQNHWNTLMSSGQLIPIWTWHKKNELMTIGMSMEREICLIRGRISPDLHYWTKLSVRRDFCGPVRDWQKSKRHHIQITYGLTLGQEMEKPLREEKNKNGQSRNRNSNMPENWEEVTLLIQAMKSTLGHH